jgi:hypothetical protein
MRRAWRMAIVSVAVFELPKTEATRDRSPTSERLFARGQGRIYVALGLT